MTLVGAVPLVSVIIPVFNRKDVLVRAVRSVHSQSYRDFELIIVDDASRETIDDGLSNVLPEGHITLLHHEQNRGAAASRNTGVKHASGRYLAFLDSDDEWHPDKLERQVAFMKSDPQCSASCTAFTLVSEDGCEAIRAAPATIGLDDLLWGCRISPGSTLMVERSLFETTGPLDETLRRLEDWDWLLRAGKHAPIKGLNDVLARVHHDGYAHVDEAPFLNSVHRMTDYVRAGRYGIPRAKRRVLLSAIQFELAAMSYRKRRFGAAIRAMAASIAYCPCKRPAHFVAALNTLRGDVGRIMGLTGKPRPEPKA